MVGGGLRGALMRRDESGYVICGPTRGLAVSVLAVPETPR